MTDQLPLRDVALDDKYDLAKDRVFITGTQAIVRLLLMQQERDRRAGLNTAGFVSGYRGSPLGGLDQNLLRAGRWLEPPNIVFQPGLNEELAATAVLGHAAGRDARRGQLRRRLRLWYGKGPGVDRSGDVFRHANMAGTSPHGGVLALMGDDHTAESSTVAHQSEFHFVDVMIPILNPAGVQEILDYGLYGYAMSRFCGTWVAFKCVKETVESTASVDGSLDRVKIVMPGRFRDAARRPQHPARATASSSRRRGSTTTSATPCSPSCAPTTSTASSLSGGRKPKIGVITVGKSYLDVRQALDDLGIDEVKANDMGLRLYKVACPGRSIPARARGLRARPRSDHRRRGEALADRGAGPRGALRHRRTSRPASARRTSTATGSSRSRARSTPTTSPSRIGERLLRYHAQRRPARPRRAPASRRRRMLAETSDVATRTPYFCSGCPHNTSTKVPEGMRAYAGIGCHYMVAVDGPLHRRLHADGRRGRELGRRVARSRSAGTSSRISATAPTTIPASWRCAGPSRPRRTSPTRSSSTTPSR